MHVLFLFHAGLKRATIKVIMFRKMKVCSENVRMIQFLPKLILCSIIVDVVGCQCASALPVSVFLPLPKVGEHFNNRRCTVVMTRDQTLTTVMGNTRSNIYGTDLIPQFSNLLCSKYHLQLFRAPWPAQILSFGFDLYAMRII